MPFKRIRFVTDSVADMPVELAEKLNVEIVPCYVNYDGNSYLDDGVELVRSTFYDAMWDMSEPPKTSAMSPEMAYGPIRRAYDDSDHVIIVATAAKLSGIYNAMRLAVQDLDPDRVSLVDSTQLSIGMTHQVVAGAEVAAETGDVEKTLAAIRSAREHLKVYVALDTMEFLRRSGRVPWATASVGKLLKIKPILEVYDNEVLSAGRMRTFKRALEKMAAMVRESGPIERAGILHINNPEGAALMQELLADMLPDDVITGLLCPAIGTHVGPGAVGIAVLNEGWKNAIST